MADNIPSDHLDIYPGPASPLSPPNAVRLTTTATGIQASVNGGAPGSVGGSTTPPLFGAYFAQAFQQLTGLSPLQIAPPYISNFANYQDNAAGGAGSGSQGGVAAGTGASVAYNTTANNGVLTLLAPNSGAGFADWTSSVGSFNQVPNMRTKKWLAAALVACGKAPGAASAVSIGIIDNTTMVGIGYLGAAATWAYVRGTTPGATVNTPIAGATIDSTDLVYKWIALYNDGTNVKFVFDVLANGIALASFQTAEASANLPASPGRLFVDNEGTGTTDKIELAAACLFNEF